MASKKIIEKIETSLDYKKGEEIRKMNYFDIVRMGLDAMPQGGFTRDDIKKRNKIEEKLIGEKIELDHDDFHYVKKICNEMTWNTRHVDIENFLDYLDDVK